jgi:hypothetical protein
VSNYDRVYMLVQEIEANAADLEQAAAEVRRERIHRPIPGRLGTVTVSGEAGLASIDLDRDALRYTTGAALGRGLLTAIIEAETEFRARYRLRVSEARRDVII